MSAKGDLTVGNKTYLNDLFVGETYSIQKDISSKYFEKGKFMEEDGITLLNQAVYPGKLLLKNKERKNNDFIHGEADCIVGDTVYDIKNAYDLFTFGKADLTTDYYWQLVGYMWLWDKPNARLFYCLNNTPEHLLCDEERKLFYTGRFVTYENPDYIKACEELRASHNYSAMQLWERFKVWDLARKDEDIKALTDKIEICRKHLNKLQTERDKQLHQNVSLMKADPSILLATHSDGLTHITAA